MIKYFAARETDVQPTGKAIVTVKGMSLGIFHVDGQYYAWRNVCPHAGAPVCVGLTGGTTLPSNVYEYEFGCDGRILRCPWHGWEFDLASGKHLADPSVKLRGFDVTVEDGDVYVWLSA